MIRPASLADSAALAALARATFIDTFGHLYPKEELQQHLDAGYTERAFAALLSDTTLRLWAAEENGALAGYAQAGPCKLPHPEVKPSHGELMRLYVLPQWKGRGLAQQLMDEAMSWLRSRFEGPLWLGVYSENFRAQKFYERYGFQKVGEYDYPVGKIRDREFILRVEG